MGFFLQQQGAFQPFLYDDPTDDQAAAQAIGSGDGSTTIFQLVRSMGVALPGGGFAEPITAPNTLGAIYFNGVRQSPSAYTLDVATGLVTFAAPPPAGQLVTADFTYYFRVRFTATTAPISRRLPLSALGAEAGEVPVRLRLRLAMRPASAALQSYLAANDSVVVIDLYTLRPAIRRGAALFGLDDAADPPGHAVSRRQPQPQRHRLHELFVGAAFRALDGDNEDRHRADRARASRSWPAPATRSAQRVSRMRCGSVSSTGRHRRASTASSRRRRPTGRAVRQRRASVLSCGSTAGSPTPMSGAARSR